MLSVLFSFSIKMHRLLVTLKSEKALKFDNAGLVLLHQNPGVF